MAEGENSALLFRKKGWNITFADPAVSVASSCLWPLSDDSEGLQ